MTQRALPTDDERLRWRADLPWFIEIVTEARAYRALMAALDVHEDIRLSRRRRGVAARVPLPEGSRRAAQGESRLEALGGVARQVPGRECYRCRRVRPLKEFSLNGSWVYCRSCEAARVAAWRARRRARAESV